MNKILIAFGTRPELIKLAPLINEFRSRNLREKLFVVNTNQHKDFIQQDLNYFEIEVDYEFNLSRNNDSLSLLNGLLLLEFNQLKNRLGLLKISIDMVIAQGDTCTSFSAAQFAFYEKLAFVHIEAGLRTYDFNQPFPEEFYRKTISSITKLHFAPTINAQKKLLAEGIPKSSICVTGNTVIDNLKHIKNLREFKANRNPDKEMILITIHRRENVKDNFHSILNRLVQYVKNNPSRSFVWIDNPGYRMADQIGDFKNLTVTPPITFFEMLELYKCAELIITDSGGIQEEAAYLGIPTLLFRTKTERIEGIESGISKYIEDSDIDLDVLIDQLNKNRQETFNPIYGDGNASKRIVDELLKRF